jgi:hypothetical protein
MSMKFNLLLSLGLVLSSGFPGSHCNAAIVYPESPDGGRQIVYDSLKQLPRSMSRYLGGFQIEELGIANPFRAYSVDLTNLASGQLLSATKSGNWCYLLMHGTNAVAAAELAGDVTNGKALKFAGLEQTDYPYETLKALQMVEKLPQMKQQNYEVRRLNCPAILFAAVWLHGKTDDIIIPLPPTRGRWNAYQPCSESQMIKFLKPEAERRFRSPVSIFD